MPPVLKRARDGRVKTARFYSTGEVAVLLGISCSTTKMWIDQRVIPGFRIPGARSDRRVMHGSLTSFIKTHPQFKYALDRLIGYDQAQDFPEGTEPTPPPMLAKVPAPRSTERPRGVRHGRIPFRSHYALREVAYACGVCRRTVWKWVRARELLAIRAPATGPCTWRFLVPRPVLLAFIDRHPSYSFALSRIEGCQSAVPDFDPDVRSRKEPLIPPGAPEWRGHPHQTRRGGFKKGPKLPDGRQPSLTAADIAAMVDTDRQAAVDTPSEP
jgi:excisionase family DNA binding protein